MAKRMTLKQKLGLIGVTALATAGLALTLTSLADAVVLSHYLPTNIEYLKTGLSSPPESKDKIEQVLAEELHKNGIEKKVKLNYRPDIEGHGALATARFDEKGEYYITLYKDGNTIPVLKHEIGHIRQFDRKAWYSGWKFTGLGSSMLNTTLHDIAEGDANKYAVDK